MDKKIRIIGIIVAVAASIAIILSPSDPVVIPQPITNNTGTKSVEIIATHLQKPWAMDFAGERIFFTEKVGRIRVVDSGTLVEEPLATLRVADVTDGGLLGIALHPDFESNHYLYVFYTYAQDGKLWNKVVKITESENKLVDATTILDKVPGAEFDNGGVIKFGPDKKLYVGIGDATDEHAAQDLKSPLGKILRLNDDGTIPEDNPFPSLPVFSYGHRNPQGMAWDTSGNMYLTEHGPTKNDELNLVKTGQNFGWPEQECTDNEEFIDAISCYNPSLEPAGIVFYSSNKLDLENHLIMASLRGTNLYKMTIEGDQITLQKSILGGVGRIRDVNEGPDGYLYILTGNTDGRGFPDSTDDKLLRIVK